AAALVLAENAGTALPELREAGATSREVDAQLLAQVQSAIEAATMALSTGNMGLARDGLFDMAVSTRAELVLRLAAALRSLSRRLKPEALRQPGESEAQVLAGLARCYALAEALKTQGQDLVLTGIMARRFATSGPRDMVFVGAEQWRMPTGARGFTAYLIDQKSGQMHRGVEARGAGMDLTFDAASRWHSSIWAGGRPAGLIGTSLHFNDAIMAPDGGMAIDQSAKQGAKQSPELLTENGFVYDDWAALKGYRDACFGQGLRQSAVDAVALIAPASHAAPVFDGFSQSLVWQWRDRNGAVLNLALPERAESLISAKPKATLGLVAMTRGKPARPLTLWTKSEPMPIAMQVGRFGKKPGLRRILSGLLSGQNQPGDEAKMPDLVSRFYERVLEAILWRLGQQQGAWPEVILEQATALGQAELVARSEQVTAT
ncbi:MAG: hypothetical protein JKX69_14965, partial [Rhodobacteraceae bacterium]|nr:hypothetical protein [Paracoccaceae bacterium]